MKTKIRNILNKNIYTYVVAVLIFCISFYSTLIKNTKAEQMGSSPDSGGAQSVIMRAYNTLVSKGTNYGSSSSPDWPDDQGTYWNRLIYSATWEPDGTATEQDVLSGKTFYSGLNDRTIQTGIASSFIVDYSLQQFVEYDDYMVSDYTGEESTWINTNSSSSNEVWYDTRTNLYWSKNIGTNTNSYVVADCDYFNTGTYPTRGSYGTSGTDPDCGNAINACAILSLASVEGQQSDEDWYLPTNKEATQAYINGMYNNTSASFTSTSDYWTSVTFPGYSDIYGYYNSLHDGYTTITNKTASISTRCVRRD